MISALISMLGFILSWGVLFSLIKFSGLLLPVDAVASQRVSWGHRGCHSRQPLVSLPCFSHQTVNFHPHLDMQLGWETMLLLEDVAKKKKKGSSNLTCLECISRLKFLTGIREAVESSPALREFHPSLWTSHSLSWPQVLWKWALCVDSLTLFADKSQLQSGRATGKQNCALTPSPHSWAFIPTWTCFSIPPHLKHNYSFHQPLFICALPSRSCLFLGTCFECRKAKKPHYFICDFSLKSELKWEFLNGISWE